MDQPPTGMLAFDKVFFDQARNENLVLGGRRGNESNTFLFREYFCNAPSCDCRRVTIVVEWLEKRKVAATIEYAFPRTKRSGGAIQLVEEGEQSELAAELAEAFADRVDGDPAYEAMLRRHYKLFRKVVDDDAHPDHRKVRGPAHDDPTFVPPFPKKKPRAKASAGALAIVKAAGATNKSRQRFGRLIAKVDKQKQQVKTWRDADPAIKQEIAIYASRHDALCKGGRELVAMLDKQYADPGLTKTDRKKLQTVICKIARDLIAEGHDDLKPIYNRYSNTDIDRELAAADAQTADLMKAALELFGLDVDDPSLRTAADVEAAAGELFEKEEAEAEARRARRKKTAKQLAREAQDKDAGKALQDVFRRLALALHPDLERDAEERARKTLLMAQANAAYEANDLLALLELQLRLERVDAAKAETIAEDRLHHYIAILEEQSRELASELAEHEMKWRVQLDLEGATLSPQLVLARIRADVRAVEGRTAALRNDLGELRDVKRLKTWLKDFQPSARQRDAFR